MTGLRSPPLEIIVPYGRSEAQNHFVDQGEATTYCGRDRYGWSVIRLADLREDLDSPYTCKRCIKALLS